MTAIFNYHQGPDFRCTLDDHQLHCGDCFTILVHRTWHNVRIELAQDWYLVGLPGWASDYDGFVGLPGWAADYDGCLADPDA